MAEELDEPVFRSWEDYWAILVRRRWWILLPTFFIWVAVWSASWFLPVLYQSESVILVEQQKVPDQYVVPNVTSDLQDRLQNLTEQILSRTRLQGVVDRFHLYPRNTLNAMDPVDEMRNYINIEMVSAPSKPGDYTAFKLRYSTSSPKLAQQVDAELASMFIAENDKTQQQLSENTSEFLASQLADARANMAEQEAKVADFKEKHLGELPSQLESNMQILGGLQSQLQSAQQNMDAARQQKLYLESLVQGYQAAESSFRGADGTNVSSPQTFESQLFQMHLKLQDLQSRYTDDHPDVVALKQQIAQVERLKKQSDAELAAKLKDPKGSNGITTTVVSDGDHGAAPSPIMQVQSQLKANQLEISNVQQHEQDLEKQIAAYEGRLNLAPQTEQELTAVSRGYEESKTNYNSLLQKQMQSQLATSLEQRQQGEQFRVIDPPSLPSKPWSPNYVRLSLGGLGAGLAVGLALTILMEMTNVRVRHEKEILEIVPTVILVGIPHLSKPGEARSRLVRWWTELGAAAAMLIVVVLGNLYVFLKG